VTQKNITQVIIVGGRRSRRRRRRHWSSSSFVVGRRRRFIIVVVVYVTSFLPAGGCATPLATSAINSYRAPRRSVGTETDANDARQRRRRRVD